MRSIIMIDDNNHHNTIEQTKAHEIHKEGDTTYEEHGPNSRRDVIPDTPEEWASSVIHVVNPMIKPSVIISPIYQEKESKMENTISRKDWFFT